MRCCGLGKADFGSVLQRMLHDGFVIVMESLEGVMHPMARSVSIHWRWEAAMSGMCRVA